MKKLIPILLSLILAVSFTACGGDKKVSSNTSVDEPIVPQNFTTFSNTKTYEEYTYPTFLSTDWGMSESDTFRALGLKDEDVSIAVDDKNNGKKVYDTEIIFNNEPIKVGLHFASNNHNETMDVGLISVMLTIKSKSMQEDINKLGENPEFLKAKPLDIATNKDILLTILPEIGEQFDNLPENAKRGTREDNIKQVTTNHLAKATLASMTVMFDDGEVDPSTPFGIAIFKGEILARIKLCEAQK